MNVLIGPDAVGKTNLIEVIGLLQAAPTNIALAILRGGGASQWISLGGDSSIQAAFIECEIMAPDEVTYRLEFVGPPGRFSILRELLANTVAYPRDLYVSREFDEAAVIRRNGSGPEFQRVALPLGESLFSQFKSPLNFLA